MPALRWSDLVDWLGAGPVGRPLPRADRKVSVCTDSRSLSKGQVFWVLKGERFDGHGFVDAALGKGGIAAVVERSWIESRDSKDGFRPVGVLLPVDDVHEAFLRVAGRHAKRHRIPRVAIAGSNGKTTTKEMVAKVLEARGPVHKTQGNLNNHVGVPTTLLGIADKHRSAVVELGTSSPGELAPLSRALSPSIAVLTNIGHEHMEFFRTLEAVREEELTVTAGLRSGGTLVLNADDPMLQRVRTNARYKVLGFGLRRGQVRPAGLEFDAQGRGSFSIGRTRFRLQVSGAHNVYNALAAIAVGLELRIPKGEIRDALESFRAVRGRMNVVEVAGIRLIDDCYNANPPSVRSAISILAGMEVRGSRIAVLGDMLELGDASREMHRAVGRYAAEMELDALWCLGPRARDIADAAQEAGMASDRVRRFEEKSELERAVLARLEPGDAILVKASHGLRLDTLVDRILATETVTPGERA
jgi:UDP-N-acetylmuramoyl-tripeptide--D-alanyl-D-alanine ligase